MKTKGIVLSYNEAEDLNDNGYLIDYQLLDDNGRDPYGNCIIALVSDFKEGEIEKLNLVDRVKDVYYTDDFQYEDSNMNFTGYWWAKGYTSQAIFTELADYELFLSKYL